MTFNPADMPEVTVFCDYDPPETDLASGRQAVPASVEIDSIQINGQPISEKLESHLIETFGEKWESTIIGGRHV